MNCPWDPLGPLAEDVETKGLRTFEAQRTGAAPWITTGAKLSCIISLRSEGCHEFLSLWLLLLYIYIYIYIYTHVFMIYTYIYMYYYIYIHTLHRCWFDQAWEIHLRFQAVFRPRWLGRTWLPFRGTQHQLRSFFGKSWEYNKWTIERGIPNLGIH